MTTTAPAMTRHRHRQLQVTRGETLEELALALMLFLMTLLATAELGLIVFQYNMMSDLAQEGVWRAGVCGKNKSASLSCDVASYVQSRSLALNPTVNGYTVDATTNTCTTTAIDTAPLATLTARPGIYVNVSKAFGRLTRVVPLPASITLQSTAQMIIAR